MGFCFRICKTYRTPWFCSIYGCLWRQRCKNVCSYHYGTLSRHSLHHLNPSDLDPSSYCPKEDSETFALPDLSKIYAHSLWLLQHIGWISDYFLISDQYNCLSDFDLNYHIDMWLNYYNGMVLWQKHSIWWLQETHMQDCLNLMHRLLNLFLRVWVPKTIRLR